MTVMTIWTALTTTVMKSSMALCGEHTALLASAESFTATGTKCGWKASHRESLTSCAAKARLVEKPADNASIANHNRRAENNRTCKRRTITSSRRGRKLSTK